MAGEAEREQAGQNTKASTAMQAYASSDGRVSARFFTLIAQKAVSSTF